MCYDDKIDLLVNHLEPYVKFTCPEEADRFAYPHKLERGSEELTEFDRYVRKLHNAAMDGAIPSNLQTIGAHPRTRLSAVQEAVMLIARKYVARFEEHAHHLAEQFDNDLMEDIARVTEPVRVLPATA